MNMRSIIAIVLLCLALGTQAQGAGTPTPRRQVVELAPEEVTVDVEDGYIVVTLARPAQVKVFTILGQPVMTTNLGAGTSRLRLPARGIYILKIGTITRRITL